MEELNKMKQLADEFFKKAEEFIDKRKLESDGWVKKTSDDVEYLENPEGDIVEIIIINHPDLSGEQLFNWDAAWEYNV